MTKPYLALPALPDHMRYCLGCAAIVPDHLCAHCAGLSNLELAFRVRETAIRLYRQFPRYGRKPDRSRAVGEHKQCTACHAVKPRTEFDTDTGRAGGLQAECKSCRKVRRSLRADPAAWQRVRDALRALNGNT